ncbi:MAG: aldolase/citrate lyase family protein [Bacillota bacterium]
MALKLMYITNKENIAKIVEKCGVDWVFIDLEIRGKADRQGHRNTVISNHHMDDVKKIKKVLTSSDLLVRVNPIYRGSKEEIDRVINDGADIVMLPFFISRAEVETFINYVQGRAKTCLLLETPEAVESIDSILTVQGVDCIHIGLNDLHLAYRMHFMFELLADGTVEKLVNKINKKGIPYGFGGIARIGELIPPAENIITEHCRLGSSMVILSRSFCNTNDIKDVNQIEDIFITGIREIRDFEATLLKKEKTFFDKNREIVYDQVMEVVNIIRNK